MWILVPNRALWHFNDDRSQGAGLCGATVPLPTATRTLEARPVGFDGLLCNRCWFECELNQTLALTRDGETREWLCSLNYSDLSAGETEKLCEILGESRALSLVVIHGLAQSAELEDAPKPNSLPVLAPARSETCNLAVIPLVHRAEQETAAEEAEEKAAEVEEIVSTEPRIKINCTKLNSTNPPGGGFGRFLKRLSRSGE